jgi:hypothetical protein
MGFCFVLFERQKSQVFYPDTYKRDHQQKSEGEEELKKQAWEK